MTLSKIRSRHIAIIYLGCFPPNFFGLGFLNGNGSKLIHILENRADFSKNLLSLIIMFKNLPFKLELKVFKLPHFLQDDQTFGRLRQ